MPRCDPERPGEELASVGLESILVEVGGEQIGNTIGNT